MGQKDDKVVFVIIFAGWQLRSHSVKRSLLLTVKLSTLFPHVCDALQKWLMKLCPHGIKALLGLIFATWKSRVKYT